MLPSVVRIISVISKRARPAKGPGKAGAVRARALHVLVVENHPDTRQGVKAFLKALGYRASFAEDKASALAVAGQETFDLLLSDISLPDGNGWELLQALDTLGRRPRHAIAMSGLGDLADRTRSRDAGFELHLVKPFRPEELEQALRRAVAATPRKNAPPALLPLSPPPTPAPANRLRKRLHDGLCQHLAAAALLQGALANRLQTLSTTCAVGPGKALAGDLPARLDEAAAEAGQISRLIDEALEETLSLLRDAV